MSSASTTTTCRFSYLVLLLIAACLNVNVVPVQSFVSRLQQHPRSVNINNCQQQQLHLVTEDDVLEAVELAESLWAKALEARKTANALCDRAEEEAEAAASVSKDVEEMVNSRTEVSMEQLAQADAAASANLDANIMVNKAMEASDTADRLEQEAEEALQKSEERLEEHLKDFPESPLAS